MASLERTFLRFRTKGDTQALAEVFDRCANELLTVAGHLAPDPASAEDLVQATFLAAIEGAQRYDATRPLMPWLVGILIRRARDARRRAGRRLQPDRVNEPSSLEPERGALDREFQIALREALSGLPAHYREVLAPHLLEGDAPRTIAQRLGRAPGTVRVQLHRGLELLRSALPAGLALGGAAVAWRGLPAVRESVLRIGASHAAGWKTASVGQGVAATWLGSRPVLAAGVFLAVAGVYGVSTLVPDALPDPVVLSVSDVLTPIATTDTTIMEPPTPPVSAPLRAATPVAQTTVAPPESIPLPRAERVVLRGQVLASMGGRGGVVLEGCQVRFEKGTAAVPATGSTEPGSADTGTTVGRTTTGAGGTFEIEVTHYLAALEHTPGGRLLIDHPEYLPSTLELDQVATWRGWRPHQAEIPVGALILDRPQVLLTGSVPPQDRSAPDLEVLLLHPVRGLLDRDRPEHDGTFRLRAGHDPEVLVVVTRGEGEPSSLFVELDGDADRHLGPLPPCPSESQRVELRLPPGLEPASQEFEVLPVAAEPIPGTSWSVTGDQVVRRTLQSFTPGEDAWGRHVSLALTGLGPGMGYRLRLKGKETSERTFHCSPTPLDYRVPRTLVRIRVLDSKGKPVSGASVIARMESTETLVALDDTGSAERYFDSGSVGEFLAFDDELGSARKAVGNLAPAEETLVLLLLDPSNPSPVRSSLVLRGLDPWFASGESVTLAWSETSSIRKPRSSGSVSSATATVEDDGSAHFEHLPSGYWDFWLSGSFQGSLPASERIRLQPGASSTWSVEAREGERLLVTSREYLEGLSYRILGQRRMSNVGLTAEEDSASFRHLAVTRSSRERWQVFDEGHRWQGAEPLPPGRYTFELERGPEILFEVVPDRRAHIDITLDPRKLDKMRSYARRMQRSR